MKKNLIYFMLIMICIVTILYFTVGTTSDICKRHRKLYGAVLHEGTVVQKFVDVANHSLETIIIKEDDKSFELLLVPDANNADFDKLQVGDTIRKEANSFLFTVNGVYRFEFMIECDYEQSQ